MTRRHRIGIVGARGHTGAELIRLIAGHPHLQLAFVSSRELDGQRVAEHNDAYRGELCFAALSPQQVAEAGVEVVVLALPNGKAGDFVAAIDGAGANPILIDLSADHRFDNRWYYGLPELTRSDAGGRRRIANPGCYATAMQLALAPLREALAGPVQCFGVSGYSGAGTTPSERNDPDKLRGNLMPYSLVGHVHEREVSRHLGHAVEFMPHVAGHFRGITLTANLHLDRDAHAESLFEQYRDYYAGEPLIAIQSEPPWVSAAAGRHGACIGGFSTCGTRAVVVATLDNLLKGAATQAIQNLNLALALPEHLGIPVAGERSE